MGIIVNLDVMMAKRKISLTELANQVDLTQANLSILKNNKAKAIRFSTLEAICKELNCQPGDILAWEDEKNNQKNTGGIYGKTLCFAKGRPDLRCGYGGGLRHSDVCISQT